MHCHTTRRLCAPTISQGPRYTVFSLDVFSCRTLSEERYQRPDAKNGSEGRRRGAEELKYIVASYPGGPRSNAPRFADCGGELCEVRAENAEVPEVEVQVESCGLTYGGALLGRLPSEEAAKDEDEDDDGAILFGAVSVPAGAPRRTKRERSLLPRYIRVHPFCNADPDVAQHNPSKLAPMPCPPAVSGEREKVGNTGWLSLRNCALFPAV